jgi:hypothetical protein
MTETLGNATPFRKMHPMHPFVRSMIQRWVGRAVTHGRAGNNIKRDMVQVMWKVLYLPAAEEELDSLPARDKNAVDNAVEKLKSMGPNLPAPHQSAVLGCEDLRELRPQAGRSPWRPLYRQVGDPFVIAAIAPEANKNKRGFDRACRDALDRLAELEDREGEDSGEAAGRGNTSG